jgi:hypothetical protein
MGCVIVLRLANEPHSNARQGLDETLFLTSVAERAALMRVLVQPTTAVAIWRSPLNIKWRSCQPTRWSSTLRNSLGRDSQETFQELHSQGGRTLSRTHSRTCQIITSFPYITKSF